MSDDISRKEVMAVLLDAWTETFGVPYFSINDTEEDQARRKINKLFCTAADRINNIHISSNKNNIHDTWTQHEVEIGEYKKIYYQHTRCRCIYDYPHEYCPKCGTKMEGTKIKK